MHPDLGIVPRCVDEIFDHIKENPMKVQFRITVSFLEIYMEQITDLLLPTQSPGGS
jgi:kinesin family protein 5